MGRELRWEEGVQCRQGGSSKINKRGFHNQQGHRQRDECQDWARQFDDLTGPIFEGHQPPLRVWVLSVYFMGLNRSNQPIAVALDLDQDVVADMTTQRRAGIVDKKSPSS